VVREFVESGIQRKNEEAAIATVSHSIGATDSDPERALQVRESAAAIEQMMSPRELECMRLSAEGFRHDEIADVLGTSIGNVSARLSRVVGRLRRRLRIHTS
jgi:DNA-directed RNA polymerase specialized sigma24 family protein